MNNKRLLELDSLRGIAALFVVFFHFTLYREEANLGFRFGVTGVDLFFIISGFVIFLTLEKTRTWQDFAVSRFSRLYPAYWVCVSLTTVVMLVAQTFNFEPIQHHFSKNPAPGIPEYLANMSMFQYYFRVWDIDGPYWTLLIEMLFYFLMAGLFIFRQLKRIEWIGSAMLAVIAVYSTVLNAYVPFAHKLVALGIPLINYFPLFFAGILFYRQKFERQTAVRYVLLALCLLVQASLFDDGVRSNGYISQLEYLLVLVVYFGTFTLYANNRLGFIVNKVTIYLGSISYSLYLIHQFISLTIIIPVLMRVYHVNFWVAAFLIDLPILLVLATLIQRFVEKPAMNLIRREYKRIKSLRSTETSFNI